MQIHLMQHPKSQGGSLTSRKGTPEDRLQEEEEEDPRHVRQDHLPEVGEVVEVVEGAEEEEGVERSHYPDTHLLNRLKNF